MAVTWVLWVGVPRLVPADSDSLARKRSATTSAV
jgi:hypothetical protein